LSTASTAQIEVGQSGDDAEQPAPNIDNDRAAGEQPGVVHVDIDKDRAGADAISLDRRDEDNDFFAAEARAATFRTSDVLDQAALVDGRLSDRVVTSTNELIHLLTSPLHLPTVTHQGSRISEHEVHVAPNLDEAPPRHEESDSSNGPTRSRGESLRGCIVCGRAVSGRLRYTFFSGEDPG